MQNPYTDHYQWLVKQIPFSPAFQDPETFIPFLSVVTFRLCHTDSPNRHIHLCPDIVFDDIVRILNGRCCLGMMDLYIAAAGTWKRPRHNS